MNPEIDKQVITIVVEFSHQKKGGRTVRVLGAPVGEMPTMAAGGFADRHKLLDDVFAALAKRKPQVLNKTQDTKHKKKNSGAPEADAHKPDEVEVETGPIGPVLETASDTTDVMAAEEVDAPVSEPDDDVPAELPAEEQQIDLFGELAEDETEA